MRAHTLEHIRERYAALLPTVEKPARYAGGEMYARYKSPDDVRARLCLAFPDAYEIGMSHMGTKVLYHVVNECADFWAERAFAPWPDFDAKLDAEGLPILTLE